MNLSKVFRLLLLFCILLGGAAIVWSFLSRRQEGVVLPNVPILSPDISRQTTQFEYTEHKSGKTVFTVYAETSTQTVSQVHTLQNVTFTYYDEGEEPSDVISAQEAVYRIPEKQIEFSGDATIQLADGTEVFSDELRADLVAESAVIQRSFRFKKGNIEGSGESLIYLFPRRELQVEKGLHLMTDSESGPIEGEASQAVYLLLEGKITLTGEALLSGSETDLKADQMIIFLSTENRIQKILSSGRAHLESAASKSLSGDQINVFFNPAAGRTDSVEVLAQQPRTAQRAVYSEQLPGRHYFLEANQIIVLPSRTGNFQGLVLEKFAAQGEVRFHSSTLGIEESNSDQMEGRFSADGEHLQQLDLQGRVSVTRKSDSRGSVEEKLSSEALSLRFGPTQEIEQASATENVDLRLDDAQGYRHLSARKSVDVTYLEGAPQRMVSRGDSQMERVSPEERTVLKAPLIDIRYRRGLLDHMMAEGGVTLESNDQGKARYTSSQRLEVSYQGEKMEQAIQSGDFHFWEGTPATIDVRSDQAVYDPKSQKVTMTGQSPILKFMGSGADASPIETLAERLEVDPSTGEVSAAGQVRSFLREEGGPIVITAGRMQADPETGWIHYSSNPRIVQQSNSITGNTVRYNHQEQELVVEEAVESSLIQESPTEEKAYKVEADRLIYKRADLRARYQGNVRVSTEDLIVDAPFVDFVFATADQNQLQEIVAWGGVEITQGDRSAQGDQAVHDPVEEKVVLTGDPAQVVESNQDTVTGRQLTFFIGDQRLFIENPATPETP
jgi:lipopolysaccharide transport protein LptA